MAEALREYELCKAVSHLGLAVGLANREECNKALNGVIDHIAALEALLDEADDMDALGTEGWRHRAGID